jgi:hypothetical protein
MLYASLISSWSDMMSMMETCNVRTSPKFISIYQRMRRMVDTGSVDAMVSVHGREGHFRNVEGSDMFTTNRHAHALASYERR